MNNVITYARGLMLAGCLVANSMASAMSEVATDSMNVPPPTANAIDFPKNYQSWDIVAVSHRNDNNSLRAIIGNPQATQAIAEGKTNPWPDGVVLGKLVWKDRQDEHWASATVPGELLHAEFIFKDAEKWQDTGGWGWARWLGTEQKPFGDDAESASASCVACHTLVKGQDWVFTRPASLPKRILP